MYFFINVRRGTASWLDAMNLYTGDHFAFFFAFCLSLNRLYLLNVRRGTASWHTARSLYTDDHLGFCCFRFLVGYSLSYHICALEVFFKIRFMSINVNIAVHTYALCGKNQYSCVLCFSAF
jgi:hypothetical protein